MDLDVKKRKRTVLTARQQKVLTKSFGDCPFPDAEQRYTLGKLLNMTPRTVQIWFQNQRQKVKNHTHSSRSSQSSDESIEHSRKQPTAKSLNTLAHVACIEYDRKFGTSDENDNNVKKHCTKRIS